MIWSRDIVFMEGKTIANSESEKKKTSSKSINRDWLEETRSYPDGSCIPVEEQYYSAGFRQETDLTEGGQNAETEQDPESDSDEVPTKEPAVEN